MIRVKANMAVPGKKRRCQVRTLLTELSICTLFRNCQPFSYSGGEDINEIEINNKGYIELNKKEF